MKHRCGGITPTLLLSLTLTAGFVGLSLPVAAQQGETAPDVTADKDSRREAKRQAREARIEEYLRKKEERLAQRELERRRKEEARPVDLATFDDSFAADPGAGKKGSKGKKSGGSEIVLPRNLARVQEIVRNGPLGDDPTVQGYLDLIDRAEASPHQLAAFGSFLSDSGWPAGAIEYYKVALSLESGDAVLWMNVGTIHRQMRENSPALNAYRRALSIDPNYAEAHYNLGAVLDTAGKYEDALLEYKIALTLDPTLGDPAVNPMAANNSRLLAVRLMLYEEQAGNIGLPLSKIAGGELPDESVPETGHP